MSASTTELLHSSKSNEWYTPAIYIESARATLAGIDLDPASCELANETVQARRYLTVEENGLAQPWYGKVFLNPPYGRVKGASSQEVWSRKLAEEWRSGRVTAAILLVNACIGDRWFRMLWDHPICFVHRRIRFNSPVGRGPSPTKGNAFVYFGGDPESFTRAFSQHGRVVLPGSDVAKVAQG